MTSNPCFKRNWSQLDVCVFFDFKRLPRSFNGFTCETVKNFNLQFDDIDLVCQFEDSVLIGTISVWPVFSRCKWDNFTAFHMATFNENETFIAFFAPIIFKYSTCSAQTEKNSSKLQHMKTLPIAIFGTPNYLNTRAILRQVRELHE